MKVVIRPEYEYLREWIETLPQTFEQQGEVIYNARNQIRVVTLPNGLCVNVKRFHRPAFCNRLIYTYLRAPKAQRAYQNAQALQSSGIGTPTPIAYLLCGNRLLQTSYLITLQSTLQHTFYDFRDGQVKGKESLIRAFAQWTANMHRQGILHLDYSPGNILYDYVDNHWQFEVVDINRLRLGRVTPQKGAANFCRLWGKQDFFEIVAPAYAEAMGIDEQQCLQWILAARKRFWRHRPHEHFTTDDTFSVGVIISTYNNPQWLEKALWGLRYQTHQPNEIIIADDGSTDETRQLIERYATTMPIRHIWHTDNGFLKTTILNKAVSEATADYLIFIDQDLIARKDFVSRHYVHARKGHFVSGGAILLSEQMSHAITEEDIRTQRLFDISWLQQNGMPWRWKMSKLWRNDTLCRIMNRITPAKASWNGGNASTWRQYIIDANGFDTRMRYGAEDREFGQRLMNAGYKGIQLRYGTPLMHLYHTRPYRNEEDWRRNKEIWDETISTKRTQTEYGMKQQ